MKKTFLLLFASACLLGCKKDEAVTPTTSASIENQAIVQYADIAYNSYLNAKIDASALELEIEGFIAEPTDEKFTALKTAWKKAKKTYGATESFRFYGGPIDNDTDGPEGLINSWPLDESYIDYVKTGTGSNKGTGATGIINNTEDYPVLTESIIESANGVGGETDVTVGFHAIEFLLWGQDFYDDSPGKRAYTDYLTLGGTNLNQARRGQYLIIVAKLLVENLGQVVDAWDASKSGNYRTQFVDVANQSSSLQSIFRGMAAFSKSEFGGERSAVALNTQDQEDEHDCFSDYTSIEFTTWQQGIIDIYQGKYTNQAGTVVDGVGIDEVIRAKNSAYDTDLLALLNTSLEKAEAVPSPFDVAIKTADSRPKIQAMIDALQAQGDKMVEVAKDALGLNITTGV